MCTVHLVAPYSHSFLTRLSFTIFIQQQDWKARNMAPSPSGPQLLAHLDAAQLAALRAYLPSSSVRRASGSTGLAAQQGDNGRTGAELDELLAAWRSDPTALLASLLDRLPDHLLRSLFTLVRAPLPQANKLRDDADDDADSSEAARSQDGQAAPTVPLPSPLQRGTIRRIAQRRRTYFDRTSARDPSLSNSRSRDRTSYPSRASAGAGAGTSTNGGSTSLHRSQKLGSGSGAEADGAARLTALEEELSLRSLRIKEPVLYRRLVGDLQLPASSGPRAGTATTGGTGGAAEALAEDEGLPPPLPSASALPPRKAPADDAPELEKGTHTTTFSPNSPPLTSSPVLGTEAGSTKGAAFARYMRKLDQEDAELEYDRRIEVVEEEEDDDGDDDDKGPGRGLGKALGHDDLPGPGTDGAGDAEGEEEEDGVPAFLEVMRERFVRGDAKVSRGRGRDIGLCAAGALFVRSAHAYTHTYAHTHLSILVSAAPCRHTLGPWSVVRGAHHHSPSLAQRTTTPQTSRSRREDLLPALYDAVDFDEALDLEPAADERQGGDSTTDGGRAGARREQGELRAVTDEDRWFDEEEEEE